MASVKVKFRSSTVSGHEGTVFYQIIHDRKQRQCSSQHHILPSEWDERRSMVIAAHGGERAQLLSAVRERVRRDVERFTKIIRRLDEAGLAYTADDVIDEFNRMTEEYSLFSYMESLIVYFKRNGKIRTAETYKAALYSFRKFRGARI